MAVSIKLGNRHLIVEPGGLQSGVGPEEIGPHHTHLIHTIYPQQNAGYASSYSKLCLWQLLTIAH